ncbi:MAG: DUF4268 domain-containing protein [Thermoleophilia bacterium]
MAIGRLQRVPLRDTFRSEPHAFTTWMEENIDVLAETVGLDLVVIAREQRVGTFFIDLLAEDGDGNSVVIENQLEKTDHDHLGKMLTYLSNMDAKTAIWVSPDPRPEHVKAANWLNEFTPDDVSFIVVKVEIVRIGESDDAVSFSVVARPSVQSREVGTQKKEDAERHTKRREFWAQLLALAKERSLNLHANISPGREYWLSAARDRVQYNYLIHQDQAGLELYIDIGTAAENKALFDFLRSRQAEIETAFGSAMEWKRLDAARASTIRAKIASTGLLDADAWSEVQAKLVDAMRHFSSILLPLVKEGLGKSPGRLTVADSG